MPRYSLALLQQSEFVQTLGAILPIRLLESARDAEASTPDEGSPICACAICDRAGDAVGYRSILTAEQLDPSRNVAGLCVPQPGSLGVSGAQNEVAAITLASIRLHGNSFSLWIGISGWVNQVFESLARLGLILGNRFNCFTSNLDREFAG